MNQKKILTGASLIGIFLILLGIFWTLNNLEVIDIHLREWWPLIIIAIGIIQLLNGKKFFNTGAWILILVGAIFLLTTNGIFDWDEIWHYWPVMLIIIGISIIAQRQGSHLPKSSTEDEIDGSAIFGSVKKKIKSKNFKGGSISTIFGGVEIDLGDSKLDEKGAVIDVSTVFGGTEIKIPGSWPLDIRSTSIFGGIENKTANPLQTKGKRLAIKAFTLFGGIDIYN